MAALTFSQPERRNYLVPSLIALLVLGIFFGYLYWRTPLRMADASITHTALFPVHTILATGSRMVGAGDQSQDDLYVLATVRIDNHLHVPLFVNDLTGTYTGPDNNATETGAIQTNDLNALYSTFPKIKPLAGTPLLRESTIPPGGHAEGTVILDFAITEADWNQRQSAAVTVTFYHQGSISIPIPKS